MSKIEKQLDICPPAYMGKGMNRENFVSTGHKCGYCNGNGWFWGTRRAAARMCGNPVRSVKAAVNWMRL